jgi:hypothetical protein
MPQANKPKQLKWPGELRVPIAQKSISIAKLFQPNMTSAELSDWINEDVERQRLEKLPALLKHYKIAGQTQRSWLELAMALATQFVPGMKFAHEVAGPVGRPGRWKGVAGIQFITEVDQLADGQKCSASEAIDIDILREIDPIRYADSRNSLRKRYYEVKSLTSNAQNRLSEY